MEPSGPHQRTADMDTDTETTVRSVGVDDITAGLQTLGLTSNSNVILHASLSSFGHVAGGLQAVTEAVTKVCGTVLMLAGSGDYCRLPAPPGLVRPDNAFFTADDWADFDHAVESATPFAHDLRVDRWLGGVVEHLRTHYPHTRGPHPLLSFLAVGSRAQRLIDGERLDAPLGPIEELEALDGDVLLLGVTHTSNTTIHLAEQRLGRGRFHRYALTAPHVWSELPNCGGESHRFDDLEPALRPHTSEVMIGPCRARRIPVRAVLAAAEAAILADPAALLCADPSCRCGAALRQRLSHVATHP
jgi:aminoglycoside 3-N-acetyltransferase